MQFYFYAPVSFEPWDWRSIDEGGAGGSEAAVVALSRGLAARGHAVSVYADVPHDGADDGAVFWFATDQADFRQPGAWVVCRAHGTLKGFPVSHPGQAVWFQCQDNYIEDRGPASRLDPDVCASADRILALCPLHRDHLAARYPHLATRLILSANGIESSAIAALAPRERDPYRLAWTSSPDRGLDHAIRIVNRIREQEPRVVLHVYYGFGNIDRILAQRPGGVLGKLRRAIAAMDQTGVVWHDRLGRRELWAELQQANVWLYPTRFGETSCISSMEAQALGAIPVCPPIWALGHNVRHGAVIAGDVQDDLVRARYCESVLALVRDPGLCERVRAEMVPDARATFCWSRVVDQYEAMASEDLG